ncbi:hypothetical protein GCM10010260_18540 [Streptomyces filipinensis]|uniref:Uncharacterized protein n=1 Tax=Streptomyces filipinensis TaxID=66887 RepID=A0A918MAH8_9ACTN|nr:hypothetical protein GCM10010260_18540 [Streptomyces filipinensis]
MVSVDGISLPVVFAPGTRDLTIAAGTLVQGEGAAEYAFALAPPGESDEPDEPDDEPEGADWVDVFWAAWCPASAGGAAGPDVSAQPAQARTATGEIRAVRASGRGRERTAHFSWGRGRGGIRRGPRGWTGDDSVTRLPVGRK